MEKELELKKLISVLRQSARMAMQSEWTGSATDAATICVERYNRIFSRLKELEPTVANIFEPLPAESSLAAAAMACRQLSAYFEEDAGWSPGFKEFWRKSAGDVREFGEFMRECMDEWARRRKAKTEGQ